MSKNQTIGIDFTEGNLTRKILRFLVPFLLANLLNNIYNTVDMIIIGWFVGDVGTVAVSLGGKMLNMFTILSIGMAGGGQILIAQLVGAKQKKELNSTIGTLFSSLGIISVVLGIVCLIFSEQILLLLNTPMESFESAKTYFVITCAGLPLIFGYNAVSSVLMGMGDSKYPLIFIAIAAVVNLVLDIVFIVQFNMGVMGTALATVIGQGVSLAASVILLYRRRREFCFDFSPLSFVPDIDKLKTIMRISVPMASQSLFIHITQLIIISYVNTYGLVEAAAFGIADRIIVLSNIVCLSVRQAGGAAIGQNFGAKKFERTREVVISSLKITMGFATLLATVSLLFPNLFFGMFTSSPGVLAYSKEFMQISAVVYFMSALMSSYSTIVTGTGHAWLSFFTGFLDGVIFRLFFCFLFGVYLDMGVTGFFMGTSFARIGPIIIQGTYFHSGAWKKRKRIVDSTDISADKEIYREGS